MTLLVATLFASTPAHALSCALGHLASSHPADGAVGVPINAVPVVRIAGASLPGSGAWDEVSVTLTDLSDGTILDTRVEAVEVDTPTVETWRVVPEETLPANRSFRLALTDTEGMFDEALRFSTGETADFDAPDASTADDLSYTERHDEWGGWRALTVQLSGGLDAVGNWWRIELADNPDFRDALVRTSSGQPGRFSDDPCTSDDAAFAPAAETWVRVTTVDVAGNEADPQVSHFDGDETSVGCSTTGGPPRALEGWAAILGLLFFGRRRV